MATTIITNQDVNAVNADALNVKSNNLNSSNVYSLQINPFYDYGLGGTYLFYKTLENGRKQLLHSLIVDITLTANYQATENLFYDVMDAEPIYHHYGEKEGFFIFGYDNCNSYDFDKALFFENEEFKTRFLNNFGLMDKLLFLYFLYNKQEGILDNHLTFIGNLFFLTNLFNKILEKANQQLDKDNIQVKFDANFDVKKLMFEKYYSNPAEVANLFNDNNLLNLRRFNECDILSFLFKIAYEYQYNTNYFKNNYKALFNTLQVFETSLNNYLFSTITNHHIFNPDNNAEKAIFKIAVLGQLTPSADNFFEEGNDFYCFSNLIKSFFYTIKNEEQIYKLGEKAFYNFIDNMKKLFNTKEQFIAFNENGVTMYVYFYDKDCYLNQNNQELIKEYFFNSNPYLNLRIYIDDFNGDRIIDKTEFYNFYHTLKDIKDIKHKQNVFHDILLNLINVLEEGQEKKAYFKDIINLLQLDNIQDTVITFFNSEVTSAKGKGF